MRKNNIKVSYVVNTRNDTDLIRKITGKDKIEETDKENAENQGNA